MLKSSLKSPLFSGQFSWWGELPAKLLDHFLRSHKSNINQSSNFCIFSINKDSRELAGNSSFPHLLPLSLSGARTRLCSSRPAALTMAFFPLPTSPPVCLLLLPSGTRVRHSGSPQKVSSAPVSCLVITTLGAHPLSFSPLTSFTFFSPASSPCYSSFSFFPPRDLCLPSLLVSLHSLLLGRWLDHILSLLALPVTVCLYVGLSALFLYVHVPLDAFGYVFNVFLEKFIATRAQKVCSLRTPVQV